MGRAHRGRRLAAAWLLLGAAAGSTLTSVRAGQQLHGVMQERDALRHEVTDLKERLARLEESLRQRRRRPVRSVEVQVDGLDPADRLRLLEQVRALLQEFVGREVDQVDPAVLARVLDGRLVPLQGRTVALRLVSVWVTDHLTVRLAVTAGPAP